MNILGDSPNNKPDAEELHSLFRELDKKLLKDGVSPRVAKLRLSSVFRTLSLTLELQEQRALLKHLLPHGGGIEPLMTVPEVAAVLRKSPDWVYRHQDEIGAAYVGRSVRFQKGEVEAYLLNQKGGCS